MDRDEQICKEHQVLVCLCSLPRKILSFHEAGNVPEFVLHELCKESCFNWEKAAYLVDNPDFDCLKGIAGYSKAESYVTEGSIWDQSESFTIHMESAPFNQKIKQLDCGSCKKSDQADAKVIDELAQTLGFETYGSYRWDLKYDNHGIVIYQEAQDACSILSDECVNDGICFLGLCPIV